MQFHRAARPLTCPPVCVSRTVVPMPHLEDVMRFTRSILVADVAVLLPLAAANGFPVLVATVATATWSIPSLP